MVITKIQKQKRRDAFNIFINGEYSFSLSSEDLIKESLGVGTELSDKRLNELKFKGKFSLWLAKALNFLSYRPRSEKEVRDKLKEIAYKDKEISVDDKAELADKLVEKLYSLKLLNDEAFGKWFIEGRTGSRVPSGKIRIRTELFKKGLDKVLIEKILKEHTPLKGSDLILKAAEKKLGTLNSADRLTFKKKLASFLLRKGFPSDEVFSVVDTLAKRKYN